MKVCKNRMERLTPLLSEGVNILHESALHITVQQPPIANLEHPCALSTITTADGIIYSAECRMMFPIGDWRLLIAELQLGFFKYVITLSEEGACAQQAGWSGMQKRCKL